MKVCIAPDSFKESLTAAEAGRAIELGVLKAFPEAQTVVVPMADGGEGTVQALVDATGGRFVEEVVTDPLGGEVRARYGILGGGETAVIEMAPHRDFRWLRLTDGILLSRRPSGRDS